MAYPHAPTYGGARHWDRAPRGYRGLGYIPAKCLVLHKGVGFQWLCGEPVPVEVQPLLLSSQVPYPVVDTVDPGGEPDPDQPGHTLPPPDRYDPPCAPGIDCPGDPFDPDAPRPPTPEELCQLYPELCPEEPEVEVDEVGAPVEYPPAYAEAGFGILGVVAAIIAGVAITKATGG